MVYFSVLDQKKIQNLMREGEKKYNKERVNEKTLDKFLEKLMRAMK